MPSPCSIGTYWRSVTVDDRIEEEDDELGSATNAADEEEEEDEEGEAGGRRPNAASRSESTRVREPSWAESGSRRESK